MKYSRDQLPCGAILNFMPLVYEHFGSWRAKASEYLQQIFKKTISMELGTEVSFCSTGEHSLGSSFSSATNKLS